jgi:hypothetical protein
MRTIVTQSAAILALVASVQMALAESNRILAGDFLFIHAQVIGCDSRIRVVEEGEVTESGEVTFFGEITLDAEGKTPEEVTTEFVAAWKEKTGQESKTIQIKRVTDLREATNRMMLLYQERKRGCGSILRDFDSPDWRDFIHFAGAARHNKSIKMAAKGCRTATSAAA